MELSMDIRKILNYKKLYETELFDRVIPFWASYSPDLKNGGIYTCLDREGRVYSTDKSVWAQGRAAWLFSYLYNVYGKDHNWLNIAKSCIDFLDNYCIDKSDGRMYFTVSCDGQPLRKRRYFFSETFFIIGNAEYYLATGDESSLEKACKYYEFVWSMYKDPSTDPYRITPKFIASTRSTKALACPMILLNVNSVMRRCDPANTDFYNKRSREIINDITGSFFKPELKAVLESVGQDGTFHSAYSAGRVVNPGHSIEASWFLINEAHVLKDESLIKVAGNIFDWSIELGWDREYRGILYFVDILGCPPEQYEHDMKLWWPHCEALISSLMLYKDTGDSKYADWFEKITKYSFDVFSDAQFGDWYGYLRRDGKPTLPACKGSTYKSGFHLIRMLVMVEHMLSEMLEGQGCRL